MCNAVIMLVCTNLTRRMCTQQDGVKPLRNVGEHRNCLHLSGLYAEILQRGAEFGAQLQAASGGALEDNVKN